MALSRKERNVWWSTWQEKLLTIANKHGYPPSALLEAHNAIASGLSLQQVNKLLDNFVDKGLPDIAQVLAEPLTMNGEPERNQFGRRFLKKVAPMVAAMKDDETLQAEAALRRDLMATAHLALKLQQQLANTPRHLCCMALGMAAKQIALQDAATPHPEEGGTVEDARHMMNFGFDEDVSLWLRQAQIEAQTEGRIRCVEEATGKTLKALVADFAHGINTKKTA